MKKSLIFISLFISQYIYAIEKEPPHRYVPLQENEILQTAPQAFFFKGEYICWKLEEGENDFVYSEQINLTSSHGGAGDLERAKFSWTSGFKAAMEYRFKRDLWKLEAHYLFFRPSGKINVFPHAGETIVGTFPQFTTNDMEKAYSNIFLREHMFDVLLSRKFPLTSRINLNFFNGLTGGWFKQNWTITYYGQGQTGTITKIKPKWRFKGGGIKTGLSADWELGQGFNWSCLSAIAAIYGNYDNRMKLLHRYPSTGVDLVLEFVHYDDFRVVTNLQFQMGPSWEKQFKSWGLRMFAGYEINSWFNVHEILREEFHASTDSITNPQSRHVSSPIQMHGLTLSAVFNW